MDGRSAEVDLLGNPADDMVRSAEISDDGMYRYALGRQWGRGWPATFVMLNPSTADANIDDPTIRRCIGFARGWGLGGIRVVNLYAYRATNPRELWTAEDPVGPLNRRHLFNALERAATTDTPVVAAWGAHAKRDRVEAFLDLLHSNRVTCLGVTKDGHPRHPLYLPKTATLSPWRPR